MRPFAYVTARTPETAVELAGPRGKFLAGGIDLLGELKEELVETPLLVNIKALPGTGEIVPGDTAWTLGANVTIAALAAHEGIRREFPGLAEAAADVASPQIRNVATLGGNLAQHSRCWYYRHRDVPCLKKGGATCFAREGENRFHSLFSGNPCISPVVSNLAVALAALGATVEVLRQGKTVALSIAELYADAWFNPLAHHSLRAGDLILRVQVPVQRGRRSSYAQISEKADFDWAMVSCAVAARVDGRTLSGVSIVLGAVAPVPYERPRAVRFLEGRELTPETAARAAEMMLEGAEPRAGNGYKVPMAQALVRRTLLRLVG